MPTLQDIENAIRLHGGLQMQNTMGPNSQMAQGSNAIGDAALNAKQAALQQIGSPQMPLAPAPTSSPVPSSPAMQQNPLVTGTPMSFDAAEQARTAQLAMYPKSKEQVEDILRQQDNQDQAEEAAQPRQFPQIRQKMQAPDVRSKTSPSKALSEDEEEQINKQLQG